MSDPNPYSPPSASLDTEPAPSTTPREGPEGLGGWLVLVCINVVVTPVRLLIEFVDAFLPMFRDGTWHALLDPSSARHNPALAFFIAIEIAVNFTLMALSFWLLALFFRKSRRFPGRFIALYVIAIAAMIVDAAVTNVFVPGQGFSEGTGLAIFRSIFLLLLWAPYMVHSKRVRNTFVTP